MAPVSPLPPSLLARDGRRKYLTSAERERFIAEAWRCPRRDVGTLCLLLAYSGCRISEGLALTTLSFDTEARAVTLRSLKKRGALVYRQVPMPDDVIAAILLHGGCLHPGDRLWPLSRSQAWDLVKARMHAAGIAPGPHMTPKGLRHGFGVHALACGIPLHLLQRWLGHARLTTTAIYAEVIGPEERCLAERMWSRPLSPPPSAPITYSVAGSLPQIIQ